MQSSRRLDGALVTGVHDRGLQRRVVGVYDSSYSLLVLVLMLVVLILTQFHGGAQETGVDYRAKLLPGRATHRPLLLRPTDTR